MSIKVLDACGHCLYIEEEIISGTSEKWSKGSRTSIKYNTPITIDHRSWRKKRFPTGLTFILWIVKHTKLKQRTRILTACHLGLHSCSGTNRKKLENERNFKRNTKLSNKVTETSVLALKCLKSNVLLFILWIAFIECQWRIFPISFLPEPDWFDLGSCSVVKQISTSEIVVTTIKFNYWW